MSRSDGNFCEDHLFEEENDHLDKHLNQHPKIESIKVTRVIHLTKEAKEHQQKQRHDDTLSRCTRTKYEGPLMRMEFQKG